MVDETDIRNVVVGQPAKVRVDALEGVEFHGKVTEIGSSAVARGGAAAGTSTTNQAKDFKVVITLEDPAKGLRSGLNATADITTATKTQVVIVPIQAVVVREVDKQGKVVDPAEPVPGESAPPGGEPKRARGEEKEGVFVVAAEKATFHPVKTGIVGETEIEVISGVAEGTDIVSGSYKTLRTLKDDAEITLEEKKRDK
jgi:HlyD family secretion protein